jgi:hypothetical protein
LYIEVTGYEYVQEVGTRELVNGMWNELGKVELKVDVK